MKRIVIIGAGIAGIAAAESARAMSSETEIVLLSKESILPYYRLNLTRYLAGSIDQNELPLKPQGWFDDNTIDLRQGVEVSGIDPSSGRILLGRTEQMLFDRLIIAMGAHPFVPPLPGAQRQGVTSMRTLDDANAILATDFTGAPCICLGGGLLGLETAAALTRRGADVTLLEGHGWLLPRQLNQTAGEVLAEHVAGAGIRLATKNRVREIAGDERVRGVLLEDGRTLDADLVVIATGIRSNSYLARSAGLEVNRGIVVDNHLRTSVPDVFAAGDVAEHRGTVYGTWGPAQYQGGIAAMNALGAGVEFGGIARSNALKVLDVELFSIGQVEPEDGSYEVVEARTDDRYIRYVFRDSRLVGAVLLGDAGAATHVKAAIEHRTDLSSILRTRPSANDVADFLATSTA